MKTWTRELGTHRGREVKRYEDMDSGTGYALRTSCLHDLNTISFTQRGQICRSMYNRTSTTPSCQLTNCSKESDMESCG